MIEKWTDCITDPRGAWAEIERLRGALKKIEHIGNMASEVQKAATACFEVAHEALKGTEAEHGV